jgi:serine/threonine protein kinase
MLAALAVAHELGVVHRDLKPENVLVLRGADDDGAPVDVVKVCDFGVAKLAPRGPNDPGSFVPHLTVDGLAIGTPDYMSPEQARGEPVDGRSDLYSVGVVLYHLLAGRPPFVGDSPLGIALQQVSDEPVPPSRLRDVHPGLEAIALRALAKRPSDRFQTAREMRRALRAALDDAPRTTSSVPPLVITRLPTITPRFGSGSAVELGTPRVQSFIVARRRKRFRVRQALTASAAGALLAIAVAMSLPSVRRAIEERMQGRFEIVQTVAAALARPTQPDSSVIEIPLVEIVASPADDVPVCVSPTPEPEAAR